MLISDEMIIKTILYYKDYSINPASFFDGFFYTDALANGITSTINKKLTKIILLTNDHSIENRGICYPLDKKNGILAYFHYRKSGMFDKNKNTCKNILINKYLAYGDTFREENLYFLEKGQVKKIARKLSLLA